MLIGQVGEYEASDIEAIVTRLLKDLGNPEPPLDLESVRRQLDLDLKYYSSNDVGVFDEVAHRLKMAGKQLFDKPTALFDAIRKAGLSALWVPSSRRIMIDQEVPQPKHRWIEGHEIGHSLIPWHREFLFGDDSVTLDPSCHATVEAEANFASARLLFLQERFGAEARDCDLDFDTIKMMAKRYGNTLTSTFWRIVEDREPDRPVFGMMTAHPRHPDIGTGENGETIRYFIRSKAFREKFAGFSPEQGYALIEKHATGRRRGPVFEETDTIINDRDEPCEFYFESFCNAYSLLTVGSFLGQRGITV
ncbi:MAG: hypothetical protein K2Y17_00595 [Qipengyuania sp.]|nr:hypothetical protein [Qipengyuania sp.]